MALKPFSPKYTKTNAKTKGKFIDQIVPMREGWSIFATGKEINMSTKSSILTSKEKMMVLKPSRPKCTKTNDKRDNSDNDSQQFYGVIISHNKVVRVDFQVLKFM